MLVGDTVKYFRPKVSEFKVGNFICFVITEKNIFCDLAIKNKDGSFLESHEGIGRKILKFDIVSKSLTTHTRTVLTEKVNSLFR